MKRSAGRSPRNFSEVGIDVTANPQPKHLFFAKVDNRETDFFFDSWAALDSAS